MGHDAATIGSSCLNCGAALAGPYCAQCGQKAVAPKPTLHELLHDALEEFLHFDGKILQTLRTLLTRPGLLTVDIVAGRRARYIAPLRLYLTVSLLFFVVAAASPSRGVQVRMTEPGGGIRTTSAPAGRQMTEEDKRVLLESADKDAPPFLRPLVHRLVDDPAGLTRGVFEAWPKAMFVLLPVFAAIVAAFHRRRRFVEHMYFALHVHAFAFLVMAINSTIAFAHVRWLSLASGVATLVWIPVYVHLAFRRVYADTHAVTVVKEAGVGFLYGIASIPAIFVAAVWVASHPH